MAYYHYNNRLQTCQYYFPFYTSECVDCLDCIRHIGVPLFSHLFLLLLIKIVEHEFTHTRVFSAWVNSRRCISQQEWAKIYGRWAILDTLYLLKIGSWPWIMPMLASRHSTDINCSRSASFHTPRSLLLKMNREKTTYLTTLR